MPFDPSSKIQFKKLNDAVRHANKQLEPFRAERQELIRQFVGGHYGDDGSKGKVPTNFIELAVQTYLRSLIVDAPKVLTTTSVASLEPAAAALELTVDDRLEQMDLSSILRDWVEDALFRVGIIKLARRPIGEVIGENGPIVVTKTFIDLIDFDDWVHDDAARNMQDSAFLGHLIRVPADEFEDMEFEKSV